MFAVAWLMLRGRIGRSFRAVRDSELAAASSGVNLATYKTLAFGISAFYAGVAGSLLAIATTFVNPDTFPITLSIFLLVGVVVGGLGSLWPLVFGAIFIQFLPLWAQEVSKAPGVPAVVYGVILILAHDPARRAAWPACSGGCQGASRSRLPSRSLSRSTFSVRRSCSRSQLCSPTGASAAHRGRPRGHREDDPGRRHGPALRHRVRVRGGRARRQRLLQVRERTRRRQRPHDHLQVPRRRLQPRADRAGDAAARRAGPGLRDLQLARHRAEPRDSRRT